MDHATNIIKEVSELTIKENINGAIKFQFRDLETFIHKNSRKDENNKHIRFLSTELSREKFQELLNTQKQSI